MNDEVVSFTNISKNIESIAFKVLSETKDVMENVKSIIRIQYERYNELEEIEIIDNNNGNTDENNKNTIGLLTGNIQSNSRINSRNNSENSIFLTARYEC